MLSIAFKLSLRRLLTHPIIHFFAITFAGLLLNYLFYIIITRTFYSVISEYCVLWSG